MITCGRCTKESGSPLQHPTVADVRGCYAAPESLLAQAILAGEEAEIRAEHLAEARAERFWENRGANDGFDEWEARRGVLQFSDAWDASDRAQGLEFSTRTGERIEY